MDITLIVVSVISGIFAVLSIILLQRGWERKLALTIEAEQVKAQANIRLAKIRQPKIINRRMPKGYKDQIFELITLLGDEKIQDILGLLTEKQDEISSDNKIINNLSPIAQGFLEGMSKKQDENDQINQSLLYNV